MFFSQLPQQRKSWETRNPRGFPWTYLSLPQVAGEFGLAKSPVRLDSGRLVCQHSLLYWFWIVGHFSPSKVCLACLHNLVSPQTDADSISNLRLSPFWILLAVKFELLLLPLSSSYSSSYTFNLASALAISSSLANIFCFWMASSYICMYEASSFNSARFALSLRAASLIELFVLFELIFCLLEADFTSDWWMPNSYCLPLSVFVLTFSE